MNDFVLEYEKPSEVQKHRYVKHMDGYPFRLYVFKERMPEKFPNQINVTLGRPGEVPERKIYTREELQEDPSLRNEPIYSVLHRINPCVNSVVFEPYFRNEKPSLGEAYVLKNVLNSIFAEGENIEEIAILVTW